MRWIESFLLFFCLFLCSKSIALPQHLDTAATPMAHNAPADSTLQTYPIPAYCSKKILSEAEFISCAEHNARQPLQQQKQIQSQVQSAPPLQHRTDTPAQQLSPISQSVLIYPATPLPPAIATKQEVEAFQHQFNWFGIGFIVFVLISAWLISRL